MENSKSRGRGLGIGLQIGAVLLALIFSAVILLLVQAPPLQAFTTLVRGVLIDNNGHIYKEGVANTLVAWIPLLLASAGALVTFTAGLWNIGIEGQIILGGIFTTWLLRGLQDSSIPGFVIILLGFVVGMIGGALWAALAGALKTFGGVNEIFGGLGLNFVATALNIWLIFGPWKRPGVASMSGTSPFPGKLWLSTLPGLRLSPESLIIAFIGMAVVFVLLNGTYFGLQLKAVGKNPKAAFLMGIPTSRYMMTAFLICGTFAGLAGAVQVIAVYHRLIPSISSGYGFLGLLVAMLVNFSPTWVPLVALFFAALNIGSIQLPIVMKVDSSLSGVIQGALVLSVLLMDGVRKRLVGKLAGGSR
ncbi:MAG TPA: ABC transporter permease [Anaerolineaceae bacterium]